MDAPVRIDAHLFEPFVGRQQITQIRIGVSDMVHAFLAARLSSLRWAEQRQVGKGETMMFVIVGEKSERRVLIGYRRLEYFLVPIDHLLVPARTVNNMREL